MGGAGCERRAEPLRAAGRVQRSRISSTELMLAKKKTTNVSEIMLSLHPDAHLGSRIDPATKSISGPCRRPGYAKQTAGKRAI